MAGWAFRKTSGQTAKPDPDVYLNASSNGPQKTGDITLLFIISPLVQLRAFLFIVERAEGCCSNINN